MDTNGLDLTTNEDILRKRCERNNADLDFMKAVVHDVLFKNNLSQYLRAKKCTNVSLLCGSDRMTDVFTDILSKFGIKVCFASTKTDCECLSDDEWENCQKSDLILRYDSLKKECNDRDGINVVNIYDIVVES